MNNILQNLKGIKYGFRKGWRTISEVESRVKLDVFDYRSIIKPLKFHPFVSHTENNLYGNGYVIGKYFNNINLSVTTIEHGLYIGSLVPDRHLVDTFDSIITFSEYRKKFIEAKTDKEIITIGPYIKYAQSLYSQEKIDLEKKRLGHTLLVFPSHSIDCVYAKYDISMFIEYIKNFKNKFNFDTVLICLYWKDIALNIQQEYINAGFSITSAGHSYDPYFLNRLKTIILLSDATITNAVGTHVGYAVSLNKPTQIWDKSQVQYHPISGNEIEAEKELTMRQGTDLDTHKTAVNHIKSVFSSFNHELSTEQKNCVKYYWGDYIDNY